MRTSLLNAARTRGLVWNFRQADPPLCRHTGIRACRTFIQVDRDLVVAVRFWSCRRLGACLVFTLLCIRCLLHSSLNPCGANSPLPSRPLCICVESTAAVMFREYAHGMSRGLPFQVAVFWGGWTFPRCWSSRFSGRLAMRGFNC